MANHIKNQFEPEKALDKKQHLQRVFEKMDGAGGGGGGAWGGGRWEQGGLDGVGSGGGYGGFKNPVEMNLKPSIQSDNSNQKTESSVYT